MKSILGNILVYCKKTQNRLLRLLRSINLRFRCTKTNEHSRKNSGSAFDCYSSKAKSWRNNKKLIAAGGCAVIVTAVLAAVLIPAPSNSALVSVGEGVAGLVDVSAGEADGRLAVTSGGTLQSSASDELAVTTDEVQTMPTPEPSPIPTTAPDVSMLWPGCHDAKIIDVQERLMELDYMDKDEPTDYYGNGTKYALQLFQRNNNLQVDGLLGEKTLAALFSADALPYTVKLGDRGTDISAIQERLHELKYLKAVHTGYFGTDTETAVKNFQKRNGLKADGIVGEYTREKLYSEDAKSAKASTGGGGGGSGGTGGGTAIAVGDPDQVSVNQLLEIAKSKLGCEYTRSRKGPNEFDCSGFVYYCLNTAGYRIGYMTSSGWAKCGLPKVTRMSDMKAGDIICFKGHVGIYMGGGQMIDASSSCDSVRICSNVLDSKYWKSHFICARRVF